MEDIKSKKGADILYNIDEVRFEDKRVYIRGWAFSTDLSNVDISSDQMQEVEVKRMQRPDVKTAYEKYEVGECGFVLEGISSEENIQLKLASQSVMKEQKLGLKTYNRQMKRKRYLNVFKKLNFRNLYKTIAYIKKYGIKQARKRILSEINGARSTSITYEKWRQLHEVSEKELESQRKYQFLINPKVSIIVPTYNTPIHFLREMIESVINQTYSNWELCIADGNSQGTELKTVLERYAQEETRIKLKFLDENKGIAGNTNECLSLCTGEYIALFDHDDLLTPNALFEMIAKINEDPTIDFIYSDEDKVDEHSKTYFDPHFKQDWAPDTFRSYNYICHFTMFKRSLLERVGEFNSAFDGSQDYDMFLRLTEVAERIVHIPKVLYHWRVHKASTASDVGAKEYTIDAAKRALEEHLKRKGLDGKIESGLVRGTHRVRYEIKGNPKVSIIIPTKDHIDDLAKCLAAIKKSTYTNYEVIIVENNSTQEETFTYYETLKKEEHIKVVVWKEGFNYSKINNFGVKYSTGEYIVLLNNDIELLTDCWIEEMLMHCQRDEVGIVGAKLYYPDDTIQHAGVIIGIGGVAGHSHKYYERQDNGYFCRLKIIQNVSAVTAACLMIRKDVFEAVGGLEEAFTVAFNDVDLCLRVREMGKLVVFTPYVEAYHYESKSRGLEDTAEKKERFNNEIQLFESRWGLYKEDPYYNCNLTLEREDFSLRD